MAAPTGLPSFSNLLTNIAKDLGVEVPSAPGSEDFIFGQLDDDPRQDVHAMVKRHILDARDGNALHAALVRLAAAGPAPKIVTTNYDRFLSLALETTETKLDEFRAPALPMGDDFDGLVYLHGSVDQEPRKLVLTDKDFGRAYLSDAWAARFLERMFHQYVVCFIGYSHRDVVLSYLARGLRPGSRRYAFTSEAVSEHSRWTSLGILPVSYVDTDKSHRQLLSAVQDWGDWAASGLLDKHERVRDMVINQPTGIPDEDDFLEAALDDDALTRAFCATAEGRDWLDWIVSKDAFRRLTDASETAYSGSQSSLAHWFAKNYVVSDSNSRYALSLLTNQSKRPSHALWTAVCAELIDVAEYHDWLTPWIYWLVDTPTPDPVNKLEGLAMLLAEAKSLLTTDVLFVLEELLKPRLRSKPRILGDGTEYVVELSYSWIDSIKDRLSGLAAEASSAPELLRLLENTLSSLFIRNRAVSGSDYDTWTFLRRSIEDSPQNGIEETADFVIDLARDCLMFLLTVHDGELDSNLNRWAASGIPLLQRLAIFGWRHRSDVTATKKVQWLLDQGDHRLLFDPRLRYEALRLIRAALPETSQTTRSRLVSTVLKGSQAEGPQRDYEIYDLLAWLLRLDPNLTKAKSTLLALVEKYPDLAGSPNEDLDLRDEDYGWVKVEQEYPWSVEHLHELINSDATSAVNEVFRHMAGTSYVDGYRSGVTRQVAAVVSRWPNDGFLLWDQSLSEPRLLASILEGWAGNPADVNLAERMLRTASALDLREFGSAVASLLTPRASNQTAGPPWPALPQARTLAINVWSSLELSAGTSTDPFINALNSADGHLAEFWIEVIHHDWRLHKDGWNGIQGQSRDALEAICSFEVLPMSSAWAILIRHLKFLHSADPEWTITRMLPLFRWDSSPVAASAWTVLIQTTGTNQALLDDGLKQELAVTLKHLTDLPETAQPRLATLCASITVHSLWSAHTKLNWLLDLTRAATSPFCAKLMISIRQQLTQAKPELISKSWHDWMNPYLAARTEGRPRIVERAEASAMAEWADVLNAPQSFEKAVEYICAMPAGLSQPARLRTIQEDRISSSPRAYAQLLAHLLSNTETPYYVGRDLERLYLILVEAPSVDRGHLRTIREQALRLGVEAATTWPK
ncbi:SIR2 family protein [Paenarthrobacter nicotinovorans]|uniref:SIR2 family protein n=1 Tax=Paenarthrobacter nicotinovorans TaxID=29320 RepID=UPI00119DB25D|nr:SIR2 family protein [Paenarthrobacter nicotinovorans]